MNLTDYEILYDLPAGEYDGRGISGIRTVTYRAGRSLEVMAHPLVKLSPEARREARKRQSSPAMVRINDRNRERHMIRVHEANFSEAALVVHGTYAYPQIDYGLCNLRELEELYEREGIPWDEDRVDMDIVNFLARVRRRVRRAGQDPKKIKWSCVRETGKKTPAEGLPPKYHFHMLIEGPGITREMIEDSWGKGFVRAERFDTSGDGPARLSRYFCKQKDSRRRRWSHSRNLVIPQPRVSDRKLSRRRMNKIAADVRHNGRAIFEALYPGYMLVELPDPRYSDYIQGCYIYARMRRSD